MAFRLLALVVAAVLLIAILNYSQYRPQEVRITGFVEADEIRIGSRVGGRVQQVHVWEGQQVAEDDVLVELEPFDLLEQRAAAIAEKEAERAEYERLASGFREEEVAEARARRDQLAARLAKLRAGPRKQEIAAAEARLDVARSELRLAEQQHQRVMELARRNATTQQQIDRANEQLSAATATVVVREQELSELEEGTRAEDLAAAEAELAEAEQELLLRTRGFRKEEIDRAKARLDRAAAALEAIEQRIGELTVRAPVDGVVETVELQPGDLVPANAPVLALLDLSHLWVRAYVPLTYLKLSVGQRVQVAIDGFPDRRFSGEITFISRQAEFTPGNVQTPEDRSKQVFRIKVTLLEGLDVLRPGMMGDVLLDQPSQAPPAQQTGRETAARQARTHSLDAGGWPLKEEYAKRPRRPFAFYPCPADSLRR